MKTLTEIATAVEQLPTALQAELYAFLDARLKSRSITQSLAPRTGHSVLEIVPASVGEVYQPMSTDGDSLGEMLEGRA